MSSLPLRHKPRIGLRSSARMRNSNVFLALSMASMLFIGSKAQRCGSQGGGELCSGVQCCSQVGSCGETAAYCDPAQGCQSQCRALSTLTASSNDTADGTGVGSIIRKFLFDEMLKHRNDSGCPARNFYTYDAFIRAANAFDGFGTTGDLSTRKREIAAFLAQTSHETAAPDGPYAWGYCFKEEQGNPGDYCVQSSRWPCAAGERYYGRGPIQISYNYNYGAAGQAIGTDLLSNPDLVTTDPIVSFKTAIWFWMTPRSPNPSSHDVITGRWSPSAADQAAGRLPGYGMISYIIGGESECGHRSDARVADRVGFYRRYCGILGVSPGANLDCDNRGLILPQAQVAWRVSLVTVSA
ncbi:hypothetical protein Taro_023719 [Colocasia esculenta]|uniref:chitinase n=1 Tax=Colocasia esculenta TaxID=4460 RepID=A0A843VI68_COLES|nr:hypothetical protein [Colocasia esculenta]